MQFQLDKKLTSIQHYILVVIFDDVVSTYFLCYHLNLFILHHVGAFHTIFYKTLVRCLHRVLKQYHQKDRNPGCPDIIAATFKQYHNSTLFRYQILNMDPV